MWRALRSRSVPQEGLAAPALVLQGALSHHVRGQTTRRGRETSQDDVERGVSHASHAS